MQHERRSFGALLIEAVLGILSRLPLGFHLAFGRFVSWMLRVVFRYRRDVMVTNLSRSFPELKYKDLDLLVRKCYDHLGDIFVEAIWFGGCKGEAGRRKLKESGIVHIVNPEVYNALYKQPGGMMALMSHAGNWELVGGWHCFNHNAEVPLETAPADIAVVYKRLRSRTWDRVMKDNRCNCLKGTGFSGYKESSEILRFAISNRHRKPVYIFLTDQYPYRGAAKHRVGKFLNQETLTMSGGAALAGKFGMSVCYFRWRNVARGKYTIEVVPICENASEWTTEQIMEKYYEELEKDIIAQPWNYLWTHKRWK